MYMFMIVLALVATATTANAGDTYEQRQLELNLQNADLKRCEYIKVAGTSAQLAECLRIYNQKWGSPPSAGDVLRDMRNDPGPRFK
jgi:hypothetical protein